MSYKRRIMPVAGKPSDLTRAMIGIGMNFVGKGDPDANIEDTIYFASIEGMENDDLRTLAVLVTWFDVHSRWINADRLTRLVAESDSKRVRVFWSAVAKWKEKDRRFSRLAKQSARTRIDLLQAGSDYLIERHGEDERFQSGPLRVPANVLRDRPADVLPPEVLAQRHHAYRFRIMMGPTYRADMWAMMEIKPTISAAELARTTYGSFATASQVKHDWQLLHPKEETLSETNTSRQTRKKPESYRHHDQ